MSANRQLHWEGCHNVRDLGGLRTLQGRQTRWQAVVRSDDPSKLTASGWDALYAYGIRTIISLRTAGLSENELVVINRPVDLVTIEVAIEDLADEEFVQQWASSDLWCTPLYYQDALKRWPERHAAVVAAIAQAQDGGVLFHCIRGHDRTGIIAMLLLALVGVDPHEIAHDYQLSPDPERDQLLQMRNTSSREVILNTLAAFDAETYLLEAGLSQSDLDAVSDRLLAPVESSAT